MTSQTFFQRSILPSLIAGALLAGCSDKAGPAKPPMGPMPVTVLEMQVQSVPSSIEVMAQTEGAREAEVRARVGGILMRRLYQEGDTVKAGQALFQIDRAPFEIALAEARARAQQTEREMGRMRGLAEAKAISQKEYDDARSNDAMRKDASCTTNAIVPILELLDREIGIEQVLLSTLHSVMNDQPLIDGYHHDDLRRTRSAMQSIIPVSTGLARGVERLLPQLAGRVTAKAIRVPTTNVSAIDLTLTTRRPVSASFCCHALCSPLRLRSFSAGLVSHWSCIREALISALPPEAVCVPPYKR